MRATLTLLLLLFCLSLPGTQAADAWRSIDAEGNVEYSDTPRPGAVRIELPEPRTVPARLPEPVAETLPATAEETTRELPRNAVAYREIAIVDPANDDTLRDNGGNLLVSVRLKPALQKQFGHRLQLLLDGAVYATGAVSNFAITELDRGTHTVQAVVLGLDGAPLASSAPVTFHLHRTSILQLERQRAAKKAADKAKDAQR
ncbi:MAG TPA: DUF4124 domain-containing protein [Gammaproteobacteria bacterium]|nr:DUF4124 domain-containing protein [Gammaproteobacteria bacterium]